MILREDMVEQSVQDFVRLKLADFNYDGDNINIRDAFPTPEERSQPLTQTQLAVGFNFDDGGRPAELGSNLTRFVHTIQFWVFALRPRMGKNLANSIKQIVWAEGMLPLKDISQDAQPVIDSLTILRAQVAHQISQSPRPWDQNVWTVAVQVEDTYYPGL